MYIRSMVLTLLALAGLSPSLAETFPWLPNTRTASFEEVRVTTDDAGNVYVLGPVRASVACGADSISHQPGFTSLYVAKFDEAGACLWARPIRSAGQDLPVGAITVLGSEVYVSGLYGAKADTSSGDNRRDITVSVGTQSSTPFTFSDFNHVNVYLIKLTQGTVAGQPALTSVIEVMEDAGEGFCKINNGAPVAWIGGMGAASFGGQPRVFIGATLRPNCDADRHARVIEVPTTLELSIDAARRIIDDQPGRVDKLVVRSTTDGPVVAVMGRYKNGETESYVAKYNPDSPSTPTWLTSYGSGNLADLAITPDGSQIVALNSAIGLSTASVFCTASATNRIARFDSADGTFTTTFLPNEVSTVVQTSGTLDVTDRIAINTDGRIYGAITRYSYAYANGSCSITLTSGRVARLAQTASNPFDWQTTASGGTDSVRLHSLAVAGRRLFVGGFLATRVSFGGGALLPTTLPTGSSTLVHRLSTVNGEWYQPATWIAATTIVRPPRALPTIPPAATKPGEQQPEPADDSFYYDSATDQLFAVSALNGATLTWQTGTCSVSTGVTCGQSSDCPAVVPPAPPETCRTQPEFRGETVETYGSIVWPQQPQRHIAGVPVDLTNVASPAYQALLYSDGGTTSASNGLFMRDTPGYSVLRYAGPGPALQVVHSDDWATFSPGQAACIVGAEIANAPGHSDGPRRGYPLPGAPVDVSNGTFTPATRLGQLVAVNKTTSEPMQIAWFAPNANPTIGRNRSWPTIAVEYTCSWPTVGLEPTLYPDTLVGSDYGGGTGIETYAEKQLYVQNDPAQLGFNPNDEHAFIDEPNPSPPCRTFTPAPDWCPPSPPRAGGQTLYALRRQTDTSASDPYVILKTRPNVASFWTYRIFPVAYSGAQATFSFPTTVGQRVNKPFPLNRFQECDGTRVTDTSGSPKWFSRQGHLYARADGTMQVEFFYDRALDFYPTSGCFEWLPDATVQYVASWPAVVSQLVVGETLTRAKTPLYPLPGDPGLPGLDGRGSIEVIFEGSKSAPSAVFAQPRQLVRLFDPVGTHWISVGLDLIPRFQALDKLAKSHLALRFEVDAAGSRIGFRGEVDDSVVGADPLLLINVITGGAAAGEYFDLLEACKAAEGSSTCPPDMKAPLDQLYALSRNPAGVPGAPTEVKIGVELSEGNEKPIRLEGVDFAALSAGAAKNEGYVTIAFDDGVPGATTTLSVIRVECATDPLVTGSFPYPGVAFTVDGANVFGTNFALRHGVDFGGEPESAVFDWRRFTNTLEIYDADIHGVPAAGPGAGNWSGSSQGPTVQIDLDGSLPQYIGDSYFFVRYSNGAMCGGRPSPWAGDPSNTVARPVAKLAEGWIKRVIQGLNPFQQRIVDFHVTSGPVATFVSMIRQAGAAYEGPVSFNPGAGDRVDDRSLIQVYETVLRRALELTVEASTSQPSAAIDNALLLISARIADLSMLLANEAGADSADPTIGFGTQSGEYGTLAPSIHAFQNQLPSLLDEELALLRGVDRRGTAPVYNRLTWNFTTGEGEAAYAQVYNILDVDDDGEIDAADARILFPQGHGDAWGHELSAMKSFLRLLRYPDFTWIPRAEAINILQGAQLVDYRDERKLAAAAAARAKTGEEIVSLTYRKAFVQDPNGQWQGYKDTDRTRAWGVDDWARRASQGATFDWILANALLPDQWEAPGGARPCALVEAGVNVAQTECYQAAGGITFLESGQIDRTRVPELGELAQSHAQIQNRLDEADQGLNPLGLAAGVVPFDIDPSLLDPVFGPSQTHFEQVYERAETAIDNAVRAFDYANRITQSLRRNQDSLEDFQRNTDDAQLDFKNRLIELFGYPYPADIGANGAYPPGYSGPDLHHFFYVDRVDIAGLGGVTIDDAGQTADERCVALPIGPQTTCAELYPTEASSDGQADFCSQVAALPTSISMCRTSGIGLTRPRAWTAPRRAEGELQRLLRESVRAETALELARLRYEDLKQSIEDKAELLAIQHGIEADTVRVLRNGVAQARDFNDTLIGLRTAGLIARNLAAFNRGASEAAAEAFDQDDGTATFSWAPIVKAALRAVGETAGLAFDMGAVGFEVAAATIEDKRDLVAAETELALETDVASADIERLLRELEALVRQEPAAFLEMVDKAEAIAGTRAAYASALAQGLRLVDQLETVRRRTAADVQQYRYQDITFRIARNDALQKYRAQFDLAARYAYLAASAYDYETNLLGTAGGAGQEFFTDIVRHRGLGVVLDGEPQPGSRGLADPLGRMKANFAVLKGQLGFNNPQTETNRFSLRHELLRLKDASQEDWQAELRRRWVNDLWEIPEYRRLARPFAPEGTEPEPALVFRFRTTVTSGLNFFGWPLGGLDSAYDSSRFATKIRSVGAWFENYNVAGLSNTPRIYLFPVGADVLRSPDANDFATRNWFVIDQILPVPFPIGEVDLQDPQWIPLNDTLSGELGASRRFARFRAYHTDPNSTFDPTQVSFDSRLIGRSVWNTEWLMIIPAETLRGPTLADKIAGLQTFIQSVSDIKLFFQTYSFPGKALQLESPPEPDDQVFGSAVFGSDEGVQQ